MAAAAAGFLAGFSAACAQDVDQRLTSALDDLIEHGPNLERVDALRSLESELLLLPDDQLTEILTPVAVSKIALILSDERFRYEVYSFRYLTDMLILAGQDGQRALPSLLIVLDAWSRPDLNTSQPLIENSWEPRLSNVCDVIAWITHKIPSAYDGCAGQEIDWPQTRTAAQERSAPGFPQALERRLGFARVDAEMSGFPLGMIDPPAFDEFISGDSLDCETGSPFSACGYRAGDYDLYFYGGMLVVKVFAFEDASGPAPFGLQASDTRDDVMRKLFRYVDAGRIWYGANYLSYQFACEPGGCPALEFRFDESGVTRIRFHYVDFI